jgi:hypothetical protein
VTLLIRKGAHIRTGGGAFTLIVARVTVSITDAGSTALVKLRVTESDMEAVPAGATYTLTHEELADKFLHHRWTLLQ